MSIEIKIKMIVIKGEQKIKILKIKALPKDDLPARYLEGECVFSNADGRRLAYKHADDNLGESFENSEFLIEGEILSKKTFTLCFNLIEDCGARLQKINAELKKENAGWHGEETFVI